MDAYEQFLIPDAVEEVTLPSGMKAKLRSPTLAYYIGAGSLPGRLAARAQESELPPLTASEVWESAARLLCDVFVEPRFSINPPAGNHTYNVARLRPGDATYALNWATKKLSILYSGGAGSADLESFRKEPADGGGAGDGSQNLVGSS